MFNTYTYLYLSKIGFKQVLSNVSQAAIFFPLRSSLVEHYFLEVENQVRFLAQSVSFCICKKTLQIAAVRLLIEIVTFIFMKTTFRTNQTILRTNFFE